MMVKTPLIVFLNDIHYYYATTDGYWQAPTSPGYPVTNGIRRRLLIVPV
ncbi:hypothetical protein [Microbacter margulisiae]|uniref:Uncharacterized protein n=1 Tax=Microbacter margulisiae TaxID=1350067 RepID=A0A7W5H0P7_9PORP|nr:hypothetical protein [Microbacter margulisiae]MBB3185930.1 hypothetical protein [Microbacter margulisiae]